jgi:hypothetical protein
MAAEGVDRSHATDADVNTISRIRTRAATSRGTRAILPAKPGDRGGGRP